MKKSETIDQKKHQQQGHFFERNNKNRHGDQPEEIDKEIEEEEEEEEEIGEAEGGVTRFFKNSIANNFYDFCDFVRRLGFAKIKSKMLREVSTTIILAKLAGEFEL